MFVGIILLSYIGIALAFSIPDDPIKYPRIVGRHSGHLTDDYNSLLQNIPHLDQHPLRYVLTQIKPPNEENDLWLEFGVFGGKSINGISSHTIGKVYGFDSFQGLPENWRPGFNKGMFDRKNVLPKVNSNVELVVGWFNETLPAFLKQHKDSKVRLLHIDCDLYSSTKQVFELLIPFMTKDTVIVFDELVNYAGYDGPKGELRALYEFINHPQYEIVCDWIGMHGNLGQHVFVYEKAAVIVRSIKQRSNN